MHAYEQLFNARDIVVAQALLSRRDLSDRLGYLNIRNTLLGLLDNRVIPIVNENDVVAVDELTGEAFGDNDTLSAMVANLVDADLLVMLGELQGLFTADPKIDPEARLVSTVERLNKEVEMMGGPSWDGTGRGGMATKLYAARLATASGVDTVIAGGREPDVLARLVEGEAVGTSFPATSTKMESRKRWMLSGLSTKGRIVVDSGAVNAVARQNRSLLPAGVIDVLGSFDRGDIVSILEPVRAQVAYGIANYPSDELVRIKGLRSDRISDVLGHQYGDEVVHRNNMVVL
jgi:glutamate 5-kinase